MGDVISSFNFGSKVSAQTAPHPKAKKTLSENGTNTGKKKQRAAKRQRRRKAGKYLARMVNGTVRDALGFPLPDVQFSFEKELIVPIRCVTPAPKSFASPQDFSTAQVVFAFDEELETSPHREDRRGLHVHSAQLHADRIRRLLSSKSELPAAKSDATRERSRKYDQAYSARKRYYYSIFPSTADETLEVTQPLFDGFDGAYREVREGAAQYRRRGATGHSPLLGLEVWNRQQLRRCDGPRPGRFVPRPGSSNHNRCRNRTVDQFGISLASQRNCRQSPLPCG
jgi:hypothetical protein